MRALVMSFVERYGLWSEEQAAAAREMDARISKDELNVVRLSFPDLHGLLRGKTLVTEQLAATEAEGGLRNGVGVPATLLLKDSAHRTVFPVFRPGDASDADHIDLRKVAGASDVVLIPDPLTFRVLPWSPGTGWVLCDVYHTDGQPVPYASRHIYRKVLEHLGAAGYDFIAGLELEFHIFKLDDAAPDAETGLSAGPPAVHLVNQGYQLLTELRYDQLDSILDSIRGGLRALGIPLISMEVELGPSQCEITARHSAGLEPADMMVLMRSAVKQICRRNGYHATFMCRPRIPQVISSGWHLHQSLRSRGTGENAFAPKAGEVLAPEGLHYLAGLLEHAAGCTAFSTPTINGYKRYRPYSLAPDRANWGSDNRGAMVRVVGSSAEGATHLENRIGEPAANPYLYMASQIIAGMDGMQRKLDPPPPAESPYDTEAKMLPKTLYQALAALRADSCFAKGFGQWFINYYTHIKDAELERFEQDVTEWEQREYFEMF